MDCEKKEDSTLEKHMVEEIEGAEGMREASFVTWVSKSKHRQAMFRTPSSFKLNSFSFAPMTGTTLPPALISPSLCRCREDGGDSQ